MYSHSNRKWQTHLAEVGRDRRKFVEFLSNLGANSVGVALTLVDAGPILAEIGLDTAVLLVDLVGGGPSRPHLAQCVPITSEPGRDSAGNGAITTIIDPAPLVRSGPTGGGRRSLANPEKYPGKLQGAAYDDPMGCGRFIG